MSLSDKNRPTIFIKGLVYYQCDKKISFGYNIRAEEFSFSSYQIYHNSKQWATIKSNGLQNNMLYFLAALGPRQLCYQLYVDFCFLRLSRLLGIQLPFWGHGWGEVFFLVVCLSCKMKERGWEKMKWKKKPYSSSLTPFWSAFLMTHHQKRIRTFAPSSVWAIVLRSKEKRLSLSDNGMVITHIHV